MTAFRPTRWVRLRSDPRRHLAAHIAALGNGHTPTLRVTHPADAPSPLYDELAADWYGPLAQERAA